MYFALRESMAVAGEELRNAKDWLKHAQGVEADDSDFSKSDSLLEEMGRLFVLLIYQTLWLSSM